MSEPRMTHEQALDLAAEYVLATLDRTDAAAVHDHLATCGLPHPEFEAFGGVVPALVELGDLELVEPPASLGDRIMAAARADARPAPQALATAPTPAEPSPATVSFPSDAERTERARRVERTPVVRASRFDWALRIAAVIAIVAVGAWGLNLQRQLDSSRAFDQAVASVVKAGSQPGAKTVVLAATEGHQSSGIGAVQADGSLVLAMRDLPATSGSQVYTAWVIVTGSDPVSVGDFNVDATGSRGFTSRPTTTPAGATIAVTLEANPGNTAPAGPIVSAGVTTAPPASG